MKRLIQNIRSGKTEVIEEPMPMAEGNKVLVRNHASLVSTGTERMIMQFARDSLVQKARSRPDLVRQTLDKARRDGILSTFDAVRNRLDQPFIPGYSCAGTVIEVGKQVSV
jgi:NADPH:quinone reductase-like Zn-dependent oxidoreductase